MAACARLVAGLGALLLAAAVAVVVALASNRGANEPSRTQFAEITRARPARQVLSAREFFVEVEHPGRGRLRYPGACARSNASAIGIRRPAPRLGEHTAEVLGELGLGAAELARLRAEGVV